MTRVLCEMDQSVQATTDAEKDATFDWRDGAPTSLAFAAAPGRSLRRGQYCMADWQTLSRADTNWLSPSMAKRIQNGEEVTITTTKLVEAGKVTNR